MTTLQTLQALNTGLATIRLLRSFDIDVRQLVRMQERAESEGRELSESELKMLADKAQAAIDKLEG